MCVNLLIDKFLLPIQMGDNDIQGESFYTESGQINNVGNAYDLAHTEANVGRNAALMQEQKMVGEYENGGLTEQQVFNEGVATLLVERYPETFVAGVSKEGDYKEVKLKPYNNAAALSQEQFILRTGSLEGLNSNNMTEERKAVLSTLPRILLDIKGTGIKSTSAHLMSKIIEGSESLNFSRRGIEIPSGNGFTTSIYDSLKSFSEAELALFKRVCTYRNEQQKLNKIENQTREANKITIDKLKELL